MRWGLDAWLITDTFHQEWRFWLAPPDERATDVRISRWDLPDEPLFHMIPQAFDEWGARDDAPASDLLDIYDALTGSRLAEELPLPTQDRRRQLRGFEPELKRVLYEALESGVLRFERYEVPWPFPEKDEEPDVPPPDPVPNDETDIQGRGQFVSHLHVAAISSKAEPNGGHDEATIEVRRVVTFEGSFDE